MGNMYSTALCCGVVLAGCADTNLSRQTHPNPVGTLFRDRQGVLAAVADA